MRVSYVDAPAHSSLHHRLCVHRMCYQKRDEGVGWTQQLGGCVTSAEAHRPRQTRERGMTTVLAR